MFLAWPIWRPWRGLGATDTGLAIQEHIISDGSEKPAGQGHQRTPTITIHETGNSSWGADAAAHGAYLDSAAGEGCSW